MMRGIETENRLRPRRRNSAQGFSLIEILVVLVVLLIGILAIVRLFPPGFLIIGRTYDLTIGQALSQQQLDTVRNMPVPPESVVCMSPDGTTVVSNIGPDDFNDYSTGDAVLNGRDPYYASNVNRYTRVMGETFRISIPNSNSGAGKGAVYTLQLGPVFNTFSTSGSGAPQDSLLVRGAPLARTEQSSVPDNNNPTGYAILRSDAEYAIDYANGKIAFAPRNGTKSRKFVFEYDYYTNGTPVTIKHTSGSIVVPDIPATSPPTPLPPPVWQPIFDVINNVIPADLAQLKYNSDDVSRQFVLMSVTPIQAGGVANFDNDPYEYVWYQNQQSTNTNVGVLLFNPTGYDQVSLASRGNQPLTARVDYTIFDNHIIRDDRTMPTGAPYTFRLTLSHLYTRGDILDNQATYNNFDPVLATYNGLFRDKGNPTDDLIIFNMTTGDIVGVWDKLNGGAGVLQTGPQNPTPVDPISGTITMNPKFIADNALEGTNLRCLYRAAKDWGMQVQKATTHYLPGALVTDVDFRHYFVAPAGSANPTRIYFAPCDGGKTVVLGQYYDLSLAGTSNANVPISNEAYQIVGDPALYDSFNLPYIDTKSKHPAFTGFSAIQSGLAVLNVQGVSVKSRVAWRAGSRWRKLDNDTILAATPIK
ncbi:MAG: prepilin-type N-terminal cleavage/methylation domain [Chthonomonadaceae bacterium]|nr:prepilin-type N-terminal cleavage/methylation domain [Chthonomonadaceae bacterium]